ncbi:LamG-like jellyroll fold domain-containing protein [Aeromicrobium sp.]|uniref:LamG-like jellyroll fold domain-containing protein n=1 Tax=Aeromicrobium sp. TaxID=1871063 RepID=UPI002FC5DE94
MRFRLVALGVCLAVVAGFVSFSSAPRFDAGMRDESGEAARTGKPVEIVSERTGNQTVWANPDRSFRREISSSPVRVLVGKTWKSIDLDLERQRSGDWEPKAAPVPTTLSGGGDKAPLSAVTIDGVVVKTYWPSTLPKPVVDGPVATYSGVFPGVDLRMTVTDAGLTQVLVVQSLEASRNPELGELRLRTTVSDGSLKQTDAGGLSVLDARGIEVGAAPQASMWDSRGTVYGSKGEELSGRDAEIARSQGPGRGDAEIAIRTTVRKGEVVLRPNLESLTDKDVVFPTFIDPYLSPVADEWTMIRKQDPSTEFYKWTSTNGRWAGNYEGTVQRLLWEFDVTDLVGAQVDSAEFTSRLYGSESCADHGLGLWRTGGINSATNWSNQPSWVTLLQTRYDSAGHDNCNRYGRLLEFNATPAVVYTSDAPWTRLILGLRATAETSTASWKLFLNKASLNVQYRFPPGVPTGLGMSDPTVPCVAGNPPVIGGVKPRLLANMFDGDIENLKSEFQVAQGTTIADATPKFWTEINSDAQHPQRNTTELPTVFSTLGRVQNSAGELPDGTYTWRVRAVEVSGLNGPWSEPCTFKVDNSLLGTPGLIVPPGTVWSIDETPPDVTITPLADPSAPVPANVAYYRWSLNSDSPTSDPVTATGADKRATFKPKVDKAGLNVLRVWAYSASANRSLPLVFTFDTGGSSGVFSSQYRFDEGVGNASSDQLGAQPLTGMLDNWAVRGTFKADETLPLVTDNMVSLDGTEAAPPMSSGPVVDTAQSFTASAWSRSPEIASTRTVLSQGSGVQSNFVLGTIADCGGGAGCYAFGVRDGTGTMRYVYSNRAPQQDAFSPSLVHLVGDISKSGFSRIRIMVGGQLVDSVTSTSAVTGTRPPSAGNTMLVGAGRAGSAYVNKWNGAIDDVMVMQGLLDDAALVQLDAIDAGRCYSTRTDGGVTPCAN